MPRKKTIYLDTQWDVYRFALSNAETVRSIYVYGPPGVGKTFCAYEQNENHYAVTLTEETPAAELRGHYVPSEDGGIRFHDGPATRAMREGARFIINEGTRGGPDVSSFLFPLIETPETARITLPTGETVIPKQGFQIVFTDNCPPDSLPEALQDRFMCIVKILHPHDSAYESMHPSLVRHAKKHLNKLGQCYQDGRDPEYRIGLRAWNAASRYFDMGVPWAEAFTIVLGSDTKARKYIDSLVLTLAEEAGL